MDRRALREATRTPGRTAGPCPCRRSDPRIVAGIIALAAIALLIGGAFLGLVVEGARDLSGAASAFDPYLFRVARFTLWQAALSTAAVGRPGDLRRAGPVAASGFSGPRA